MAVRASRGGGSRLNIEASIVDADTGRQSPRPGRLHLHPQRTLARPNTDEGQGRRRPRPVDQGAREHPGDGRATARRRRRRRRAGDPRPTERSRNPHRPRPTRGEVARSDRSVHLGCWLRFCFVRGTLLKRTTTGGIHVDLPSCGAEVEIYEVDPVIVILPKIPDLVLERIREQIRKPWPPPPPPEERFPQGIAFPPRPPVAGPDLSKFIGAARRSSGGHLPGCGPRGCRAGGAVRPQVRAAAHEIRSGEQFDVGRGRDAAAGEVREFTSPTASRPRSTRPKRWRRSGRSTTSPRSAARPTSASTRSARRSWPTRRSSSTCSAGSGRRR